MKSNLTKDLMKFLDNSPTSVQATENVKQRLLGKGFIQLDETVPWSLTPGKKYFVTRSESAIVAFVMGSKELYQSGFRLAAAHLDSPTLKIKPDNVSQERNNTKFAVEIYGVPIISTWLDRELSIAGKIVVRQTSKTKKAANAYAALAIDLKKPMVVIPNAAFHLNRELNKGFEYNAQNQLQAILQSYPAQGQPKDLKDMLAAHLKIRKDDIVSFDLFLYDPSPAALIGIDDEMLVSGRLDDLAMSHAILSGLMASEPTDTTNVAVFYDHEEIGSQTPEGADSSFTSDVLNRICWARKLTPEQTQIAIRKSFLISADMAHAVHPNFPEKHDPAYMPLINHGPVIKMNAARRYITSAESCAHFERICLAAGVPVQKIINRSDLPYSSTVGPIVSAKLSIPSVDIGNPMWAMHSIRETMGVFDYEYLVKALTHYYQIG